MLNENPNTNKINVLLVGDWTVDEHWLTAFHTLPTSSRIGLNQRIIKNHDTQQVQYLSGAGRTASVLSKASELEITGLGIWADRDTPSMSSFFSPRMRYCENNEFRLGWKFPKTDIPKNLNLVNIQKSVKKGKGLKPVKTTRVIRVYSIRGKRIERLERIDFEVPFLKDRTLEIVEESIKQDAVLIPKQAFNAIIIKDLNKGLVNAKMIDFLKTNHANNKTKWFISSKTWRPNWLEAFTDESIELLMIPQIAADIAFKTPQWHDRWMTENGNLTQTTIDFLQSPHQKLGIRNKVKIEHIVVIPEGARIIGCARARGNRNRVRNKNRFSNLFWQTTLLDSKSDLELPFASVLFPNIIRSFLTESAKTSMLEHLRGSLVNTVNWRAERRSLIFHNSSNYQVRKNFGEWQISVLDDEAENWENAMDANSLGVVHDRFELWRGSTLLSGFICLRRDKSRAIRRLLTHLKPDFGNHIQRPEAVLIYAPPGSGKSYLVKRIASALDANFLEFNLTNYHSRKDLTGCFDEINSFQSVNKVKPLVVFFDEIDHEFSGAEYAFSSFLTVLEDGYYLNGTNRFQLAPCMWFFVGSGTDKLREDEIPKFSDFRSRLTYPVVDLKKIEKDGDRNASLERLYYSVMFIRNAFGNISYISAGALEILKQIKTDVSVREIRKFIESLRHVSYDRIDGRYLWEQIEMMRDQGDTRIKDLFRDELQIPDFTNDHPIEVI